MSSTQWFAVIRGVIPGVYGNAHQAAHGVGLCSQGWVQVFDEKEQADNFFNGLQLAGFTCELNDCSGCSLSD
jgi:hypothetical protein